MAVRPSRDRSEGDAADVPARIQIQKTDGATSWPSETQYPHSRKGREVLAKLGQAQDSETVEAIETAEGVDWSLMRPYHRGSPESRLWAYVDKTDTCWLWTGAGNQYGYGQMNVARRKVGVHRLAYELFVGPIPDGLQVLHHCDNPPCVNPAHLFLGTNDDNVADKITKGRQARGEGNGASRLTEGDVRDIRFSTEPSGIIQARYGVSQSRVSEIRSGKSWKHVQ